MDELRLDPPLLLAPSLERLPSSASLPTKPTTACRAFNSAAGPNFAGSGDVSRTRIGSSASPTTSRFSRTNWSKHSADARAANALKLSFFSASA